MRRAPPRIGGIAFGLLGAASAAGAAQETAAPLDSVLDGTRVVEMLLGLGLVLALILALAWALRRTLHLGPQASGALRVLAARSLGARERVVLLQVGARRLLLGVAPGQVRTLHVLDDAPGDGGFDELMRTAAGEGERT